MENQETKTIIQLVESNGEQFIRINCGDFDFGIGLRNLSKEATWNEAKKITKEKGLELPSKEKWHIVAAHLDRINEAIEEAGGEPLMGFLWSGSCYNGYYAWVFDATIGTLYAYSKMYGIGVRGSLDLKNNKPFPCAVQRTAPFHLRHERTEEICQRRTVRQKASSYTYSSMSAFTDH